jgi:glycosyltransferase involved in cell wall biosynthesis
MERERVAAAPPGAVGTPTVTVLQCKFQAWLSWSQPFLHELVRDLDDHVRNVVVCSLTENLDRFPVRRLHRIPASALSRPSHALLAAARLHREARPDLMHAHFGWSAVRALLLRHFLDVPLVTTFGGRDLGMQAQLPGLKPLYDVVLAASDRVVCVSEDLRRLALARGADPDRTEVIRRGVSLERFGEMNRPDRPPEAPLRILMVGRLVPKKGHRLALEAAARLEAAGVPFRLRVLGEGEEGPDLRRHARELGVAGRIEWAGICPATTIPGELARADVLLHCSVTPPSGDREGIPNAVVEAAATGLPVVATRHGGIGEVVLDGETGRLAEEGDAAHLARCLLDLAARPAHRRALGRAGAARVRARLDRAASVARHAELYADLARERRRGRPCRHIPAGSLSALPGRLREALRHPLELSIAELLDEWVVPASWRENGWPEAMERAYGLRRHVPEGVKFPVKRALAHGLASLARGPVLDAKAESRLLEAFGRDLRLEAVPPGARPRDLPRLAGWR